MKALPKQINKAKLVELFSDQYPAREILEEVRSIQEKLSISIHKSILNNETKILFFKRFGLPTGYEMTEETKLEI